MARETYIESEIPEGTESPVYLDARQIARGLGRHLPEAYLAQGTGAAGAGFDIENVPFEPAAVVALNPAGGTPTFFASLLTPTEAHMSIAAAAADNSGDPPTITQVGANDWTVTISTTMAPDGETVTVLLLGARDVGGSL